MFHVKHEVLARLVQVAGRDLDPTAAERFDTYLELLHSTAIPTGMVGSGDAADLLERHLVDSVRAVPLLGDAASLADAGSGAGLPGVPIAIVRPDLVVTLIDHRRQRAAFLELVVETLSLERTAVLRSGLTEVTERFDVVTARALGDPGASWRLTQPLLREGGRVIYWAGSSFDPNRGLPTAHLEAVPTSGLAKAGPLVIMTPQ